MSKKPKGMSLANSPNALFPKGKSRKLELRNDGDKRELRQFPLTELRVVRSDDEPTKIVGHAAVFNKWSEDLGYCKEMIRPGAFKKSIKNDDIRALWNHDSNFVLGRNGAGTLELAEDKTGLYVEILPPDTQWARDAMVSIERGDVDQMSFGFFTIKDQWDESKEPAERELIEVEVFDVSPVTYPAYPQTDVAVRSNESDGGDADDIEDEEPAGEEPEADPPVSDGDGEDSQVPEDRTSTLRAQLEIRKRR